MRVTKQTSTLSFLAHLKPRFHGRIGQCWWSERVGHVKSYTTQLFFFVVDRWLWQAGGANHKRKRRSVFSRRAQKTFNRFHQIPRDKLKRQKSWRIAVGLHGMSEEAFKKTHLPHLDTVSSEAFAVQDRAKCNKAKNEKTIKKQKTNSKKKTQRKSFSSTTYIIIIEKISTSGNGIQNKSIASYLRRCIPSTVGRKRGTIHQSFILEALNGQARVTRDN